MLIIHRTSKCLENNLLEDLLSSLDPGKKYDRFLSSISSYYFSFKCDYWIPAVINKLNNGNKNEINLSSLCLFIDKTNKDVIIISVRVLVAEIWIFFQKYLNPYGK